MTTSPPLNGAGSAPVGRRSQRRATAPTDLDEAVPSTRLHKTSQRRRLSAQQITAIELAVAGRTDGEIAAQVGVTRETVNHWRNRNPLFIAALNDVRRAAWLASRERLRHLNAKALDVIEQHLQGGDLRAALALLKYAAEEKAPDGSTTLPEVIDDLADDFSLTLLLRDMRASSRNNPLGRTLRREWLDETETSDADRG